MAEQAKFSHIPRGAVSCWTVYVKRRDDKKYNKTYYLLKFSEESDVKRHYLDYDSYVS